MNNTIPMYLAVQLESEYCIHTQRRWLQLPATKEQFEAVQRAIGVYNGDIIIKRYMSRIPGMHLSAFAEASLSQVNHYASRAAKMTAEQIIKLCAIMESDWYFTKIAQFIDYTYNSDKYELNPDILCEDDLGYDKLDSTEFAALPPILRECIDPYVLGCKIAESEHGSFTSFGYLSCKCWSDDVPVRKVPVSLDLKGAFGEDLYGEFEDEIE